MIKTIIGDSNFIENLKGKKATFILALSNTKTAKINGITQAGIPGLMHLTPTLDSEFVCDGEVKSLENIAQTPKGVPTPALITRTIQLLHPFGNIQLLNLGLEVEPKVTSCKIHRFDINPSDAISVGAKIDAKQIFEKGLEFGKNYECKDDYIILAESVPSGTTTAATSAFALGYDAKGKFSSSFKNTPDGIKEKTIEQALSHLAHKYTDFEKLGSVSDNMLLFNAGFIVGINGKIPMILAGGTQMAAVLLILNKLKPNFDAKDLSLCTTKWIAQDERSDIKSLLEMLDFDIDAYYADFDFSASNHPALKLYDQGEAKEGVGAGGALVYGLLNGLTKEQITKQVEEFLK